MNNNIIRLKNNIGMIKECKWGFSFTNLFFGCFVPLFRQDYKQFCIQFFVAIFTGGISCFIFPFFYNKMYIKDLLESGYTYATEEDRKQLIYKGLIWESLEKEEDITED